MNRRKPVMQFLIAFAALLTFLCGLGICCLLMVQDEIVHVAAWRETWLPAVRATLEMRADLRGVRLAEFRLATHCETDLSVAAERADALLSHIRRAAQAWKEENERIGRNPVFDDLTARIAHYLELDRQVRTLAVQSREHEALALLAGAANVEGEVIEADLDLLEEQGRSATQLEARAAGRIYGYLFAMVTGLLVAVMLIALAVVLIIVRSMAAQQGNARADSAPATGVPSTFRYPARRADN
ncbi:hypothetical protein NOV72_01853 [Caballeronia novacaledonica]|uniref:Chemotaxis methyl-accepting receptor HlyB-like 4HB MCP domain-containing protein n=1 Tax=Caballeronia novacaledonica TaxID=1544861 RepID=A0A2U3I396_9BURK|nr:hypothetical protein [Caballeronia novacaledonica]SPB14610.1 hypothetical protein NOV72_01853 [Caballeronia novacaledonica]